MLENDESYSGLKVVGIDEAGRGPLAGPVVAAGVILNENEPILGLKDSKKLSEKKREALFNEIKERAFFVEIAIIDAEIIDEINILRATFLAMSQVAKAIKEKTSPDIFLIDGNQKIPGLNFPQQAIIKGDQKISSIMAASIMAKVTRDRLMKKYCEEYAGYGFSKHKGYGTRSHLQAIEQLGPCKIHRKSFAPIKNYE